MQWNCYYINNNLEILKVFRDITDDKESYKVCVFKNNQWLRFGSNIFPLYSTKEECQTALDNYARIYRLQQTPKSLLAAIKKIKERECHA